MKTIVTTLALCLATTVAIQGQNKAVNSAFNAARSETPDIAMARKTIQPALTNDESKNQEKTWYVAGYIEQIEFETERNKSILSQKPNEVKMYTALKDMYTYYMEAIKLGQIPNEKGKVKPRYLRDIKDVLFENYTGYINAGNYYFNEKEYKKAYENYSLFLKIPDMDFMQGEKFPVDTLHSSIKYYAAIAAVQSRDSKLAIKALEGMKREALGKYPVGNLYKEDEIYSSLIFEYQQIGDTASVIANYREASAKFPQEIIFIEGLINSLINTQKYDEAIQYLDEAISKTEKKEEIAVYYNVKGSLYESLNNEEQALASFEKAVESNPTYADGIFNIGRIYFNRGLKKNEEVNQITDNRKYNAAIKSEVEPFYQKSLPFFEQAYQLKPDEILIMRGLFNCYYKLNMGDKVKELEAKMNSL